MTKQELLKLKNVVQVIADSIDPEVLARALGCKGSKRSQEQAERIVIHTLKRCGV
jgi:hypothetical protein